MLKKAFLKNTKSGNKCQAFRLRNVKYKNAEIFLFLTDGTKTVACDSKQSIAEESII